jgi:perosamine synthetase
MQALLQIAQEFNLFVIEDATEALGSHFSRGRLKGKYAGAVGDMGCLSFNGNKIITAGGGGMIVTDDVKRAEHVRYLIGQAKDDDLYYKHTEIGYNYKFSNLQAAMGVAQVENLDKFIDIKRAHFTYYKNELAGYRGLKLIAEPPYAFSNYWLNSLVVNEDEFGSSRDNLLEKLRKRGIMARPLWALNHLQKPYQGYQAYAIEKAHWYAERILNLPSSVGLSKADLNRVVSAIKDD